VHVTFDAIARVWGRVKVARFQVETTTGTLRLWDRREGAFGRTRGLSQDERTRLLQIAEKAAQGAKGVLA
jgi:hypothetical protein